MSPSLFLSCLLSTLVCNTSSTCFFFLLLFVLFFLFYFIFFSPKTVRLSSACSPVCCGRPLHIPTDVWLTFSGLFANPLVSRAQISLPRDLLTFPSVWELFRFQSFLSETFPSPFSGWGAAGFVEPFCSVPAPLVLVYQGRLVCVCLPYCLLLSHRSSPNATAPAGCQQEEDKMYHTV